MFKSKSSTEQTIAILFGMENTFPAAFVDRVNEKKVRGIKAEAVKIDKVIQAKEIPYSVIIDRISQDVPFYRAYLKNAAMTGTAVINNPFWWSADEKFFNNCLAEKVGVAVPKTVLLPSNEHPPETTSQSMRNLAYPLDWDGIFDYVGFPAFFKPHSGGGWKNVYKIDNRDQFYATYNQTGTLVMMLQEAIEFTDYFRCYCLDGKDVRVMEYDPRQPHESRYVQNSSGVAKKLLDRIERDCRTLNQALGYDFNTVEFAVRDGIPYAIDFCNPAPDADVNSIGQANFEWIVEAAAEMAIKRAQTLNPKKTNLTWGNFMRYSVQNKEI